MNVCLGLRIHFLSFQHYSYRRQEGCWGDSSPGELPYPGRFSARDSFGLRSGQALVQYPGTPQETPRRLPKERSGSRIRVGCTSETAMASHFCVA